MTMTSVSWRVYIRALTTAPNNQSKGALYRAASGWHLSPGWLEF